VNDDRGEPPPTAPTGIRCRRAAGLVRRLLPVLTTIAVFALIFDRVPLYRLEEALRQADYRWFLALMVPNALIFFAWDTLVLTVAIRWFHGPIAYRELLPARAVSYVVALFNTNLARGALAGYLARRLQLPLLELGSTVLFLVMTEYTHLVTWATLGLIVMAGRAPAELLLAAPATAVFWLLFLLYTRFEIRPWDVWPRRRGTRTDASVSRVRHLSLLRTFRIAPLRRYVQTVALRAPLFFFSS
jgi:hypothetical protein